jgi:release factor glutamine methyltransferase
MSTVAEALREAARRLEAVTDTARLDAEVLMAEALGMSRSDMLLHHMADNVPDSFEAFVMRRLRHEPVAQIRGRKEFYGLELIVTPNVLIPRADSETLIEAAREALGERTPRRILDLGTGSGALLLAAMSVWHEADGVGIDNSLAACVVAMRNAQRHANTFLFVAGDGPPPERTGRPDRGLAHIIHRDWSKRGWIKDLGLFDLILCNPPYVETMVELPSSVRDYEPPGALYAGPKGLDAYRILVPQLPALLAPKGVAVLEIGAKQTEAVARIAASAGFRSELRHDLGGLPRALILRLGLV